MSRIDNVKRITVEEFPDDDKETVGRIAEYYNYFAEQVTNTLNGNINYDNLKASIVTLDITVGANGRPLQTTRFSASTGIQGIKVVRAINSTNPSLTVDSAPFVSYSTDGTGIYTITAVTGLQTGQKYSIVMELVIV